MNKLRQLNWTYVITVTVVHMFLFGAAAISFSHIVDVSTTLGLTWEAWTVPFFIDGIAILGKVGRSKRFTETTQKAGLGLMAFGGALSLAANIAAGDNAGQQGYGVLVVVGFVLSEWYAGKLEAAPAAKAETVDPEMVARRQAAAAKAAQTRKANADKAAQDAADALAKQAQEAAEAAAKAEEKRAARRARAAARRLEAIAQTSPGHPAVILSPSDKEALAQLMARS